MRGDILRVKDDQLLLFELFGFGEAGEDVFEGEEATVLGDVLLAARVQDLSQGLFIELAVDGSIGWRFGLDALLVVAND